MVGIKKEVQSFIPAKDTTCSHPMMAYDYTFLKFSELKFVLLTSWPSGEG